MEMSTTTSQSPHYFVPDPSSWPMLAGRSRCCCMARRRRLDQRRRLGQSLLLAGFCVLFYMLYGWFGDGRSPNPKAASTTGRSTSFRWSMSWFIFSEVMFFAALLRRAVLHARHSVPWLGDLDHKLLWPDFKPAVADGGPGHRRDRSRRWTRSASRRSTPLHAAHLGRDR